MFVLLIAPFCCVRMVLAGFAAGTPTGNGTSACSWLSDIADMLVACGGAFVKLGGGSVGGVRNWVAVGTIGRCDEVKVGGGGG